MLLESRLLLAGDTVEDPEKRDEESRDSVLLLGKLSDPLTDDADTE